MFAFLETLRPGLFQFEIDIQSTNPETLEAIRRPIDSTAAGAVIRRLRRMENIHLHADLILRLPFENADSFRTSINDMFAMQPHYIQMGLLKLLPETEISRQAEAWEFKAGSKPPYAVLANRWMDDQTLRSFYWLGECIEHCINNRYFPSLWHYLVMEKEDMAAFFSSLADRFYDQGYFWKAATQKTICRLLLEETSDRDDFDLARELICYDWLRCGHRYLPEQLCYHKPLVDEIRRSLYNRLPQEMDGLFTVQQRKSFIKTSVFHWFSVEVAKRVGMPAETDPVLLCFVNERDQSVHCLNKVSIVQITD